MVTAFMAASFYHLFTQTSISAGVIDASKKAHMIIAVFFIVTNMYAAGLVGVKSSPKTSGVTISPTRLVKKMK